MDNYIQTLSFLGLGKNDVKVYIALLQQGRSSIVDIAKYSGVHRVNVYDAIRNLQKNGLVSAVSVAKKQLFEAAKPSTLQTLLKAKEAEIEEIIPKLSHAFERSENKAQNFEGVDGIKSIIEDMIAEGKPIVAFGIPKILPETLGGYLATFHRRRIAKKISIDHIYNENAQERISFLNKLKYSRAKYLPPEYSVPATTLIYGNKVAIWIWADTPFSVLIESKLMADAYRKYFHILWKLAK